MALLLLGNEADCLVSSIGNSHAVLLSQPPASARSLLPRERFSPPTQSCQLHQPYSRLLSAAFRTLEHLNRLKVLRLDRLTSMKRPVKDF